MPVTKPTKAIVAGLGVTLTILTAILSDVGTILADDRVATGEIAALASVLVEAAATIYMVWRVPNREVNS